MTHLKQWTLRSLVRTEILCRAIPWSRLPLERGEIPNDLNLRMSERLAAAIVPLSLASLVAVPILAVLAPLWLPLPLSLIAMSIVCGCGLFGFFLRKRGPSFAARAWLFHQHHLTYSAATFAIVALHHTAPRRRPR